MRPLERLDPVENRSVSPSKRIACERTRKGLATRWLIFVVGAAVVGAAVVGAVVAVVGAAVVGAAVVGAVVAAEGEGEGAF